MLSIYKRELKTFFRTPATSILLAFTVFFIGFMFKQYNVDSAYTSFGYTISSSLIAYSILIPYITKNAVAGERKKNSPIILPTSTVSPVGIIVGKYLAQLTVSAIPLVISITIPFVIGSFGYSYIKGGLLAIFAVFCTVAVMCAIGTFISSTTRRPVLSMIITLFVCALICIWDDLSEILRADKMTTFVGFFVLIAIFGIILYLMTKRIIPSVVFAVLCSVANVIVYNTAGDIYYNLLFRICRSVSLTFALFNMTEYYVLDFVGLILFATTAALFIFLAVRNLKNIRTN